MTFTPAPVSPRQEFNDYQAHLAKADKSAFLGSLIMYTVPALTADYDQVKAVLTQVGLQGVMPKNPPADSDIFRRVFTNGQRRKIQTGPDESQRLLVREVSSTAERLIKRIVAEDVDGNNKRLAYHESIELEWNKNHPERIRITELAPNAEASQLATDLASQYVRERRHLDGNAVRAIIVRCLSEVHATSVREGGSVYFVSSKFDVQVAALEKMASQISGCMVHSLPLVDDRKQRDFIRESFKTEAQTDVQKMVAEIVTMFKAGEKITPKKFAAYNRRYLLLKAKVAEYESILKHEQGVAEVGIDVLSKHIATLFSSVVLTEE